MVIGRLFGAIKPWPTAPHPVLDAHGVLSLCIPAPPPPSRHLQTPARPAWQLGHAIDTQPIQPSMGRDKHGLGTGGETRSASRILHSGFSTLLIHHPLVPRTATCPAPSIIHPGYKQSPHLGSKRWLAQTMYIKPLNWMYFVLNFGRTGGLTPLAP